jgi:hypothetical protein
MPQQIQAVMRKVCPAEGRGEGTSKLQGRFSPRFAPIRSLWLGENPYLTCPVEEFRVISTPTGAILLQAGKSSPLTGQSRELRVARTAQIGRLNGLLTGPIYSREMSFCLK